VKFSPSFANQIRALANLFQSAITIAAILVSDILKETQRMEVFRGEIQT
jgi:hypothetical protein